MSNLRKRLATMNKGTNIVADEFVEKYENLTRKQIQDAFKEAIDISIPQGADETKDYVDNVVIETLYQLTGVDNIDDSDARVQKIIKECTETAMGLFF